MIWHATEQDFPEIMRMAESFVNMLDIDVPFDRETCDITARNLMDDGLLLVGDGGMIGGIIYPHFFNRKILMAQEALWWVDPDKRGSGIAKELLDAFEAWAEEKGAHNVSMISLANSRSLARVYQRRGYRPMESTFVRRLNGNRYDSGYSG